MKKETKTKVPDGGWGWFVCLGNSLIMLTLRSLDPSFGLLFQDLLLDLKIDSTGVSFIMSVLDAIVNFSGFFVGPLLNKFSYRKIALFGSLMSCTALMLTSLANSMAYLICTYSILGGLGTGLAISAGFVALNTFFDKKRGQAVGFSMAGTALAMMLVPQMIHQLLISYGFRGSMLIIGAWALHSVVGACLLRPLKQRASESPTKESIEPKERDALLKSKRTKAKNSYESSSDERLAGAEEGQKPTERSPSMSQKIKETFDLDLLKDTVYLNVVLGTSLYYVAESNFKLMTPFFLSSIGMEKAEVAFYLSLTALTDIIARLVVPTITDRLEIKKRTVFYVSSILVGLGRSVLAEGQKGTVLIVIFIVIGFLRGATVVNLNLSVSECCSLKKLPNALGIFMVSKGIFVVLLSPLIGYIRDYTDSYRICIHVMSVLIVLTFICWTVEYLYCCIREKRRRFEEM